MSGKSHRVRSSVAESLKVLNRDEAGFLFSRLTATRTRIILNVHGFLSN